MNRRLAHVLPLTLSPLLVACETIHAYPPATTPTTVAVAMAAVDGNVDLPRFPSISPDGSQIVFSWRGDLWKVASVGGSAVRLTTHPLDDLRSAWGRDGAHIAFDSNRDGFQNIFVMNADGTDIRQVTNTDRPLSLIGFGTDDAGDEVVTFDSVLEGDVYRSKRPYMVALAGGDLVRVHDAFGSTPSANAAGSAVLFTRGGYYYGWPRVGNRGAESMDVWMFERGDGSFTQLTEWEGNDGNAKWAGDAIIYMSDREFGNANLFRLSMPGGEGAAQQLTAFREDPVQHFDVSADGSTVVFVAWDTMYTIDLTNRQAQPVALTVNANEDEKDNYRIKSINRDVSEAALSPDGKVMAYVAYGDVYVRNLEEKSPTRHVTRSSSRERGIAWSPNGLKLYFVSDEDGTDSDRKSVV